MNSTLRKNCVEFASAGELLFNKVSPFGNSNTVMTREDYDVIVRAVRKHLTRPRPNADVQNTRQFAYGLGLVAAGGSALTAGLKLVAAMSRPGASDQAEPFADLRGWAWIAGFAAVGALLLLPEALYKLTLVRRSTALSRELSAHFDANNKRLRCGEGPCTIVIEVEADSYCDVGAYLGGLDNPQESVD